MHNHIYRLGTSIQTSENVKSAFILFRKQMSRNSSVNIVTDHGLDNRDLPGFLFLPPYLDQLWGPTHPPTQWYWEGAHSPRVKRPACEAEHLPSAKVRNAWSYTSPPVDIRSVGRIYVYIYISSADVI